MDCLMGQLTYFPRQFQKRPITEFYLTFFSLPFPICSEVGWGGDRGVIWEQCVRQYLEGNILTQYQYFQVIPEIAYLEIFYDKLFFFQVRNSMARGDYNSARVASNSARTFSYLAIGLGASFFIMYIIALIMVFTLLRVQ